MSPLDLKRLETEELEPKLRENTTSSQSNLLNPAINDVKIEGKTLNAPTGDSIAEAAKDENLKEPAQSVSIFVEDKASVLKKYH